MPITLTRIEEYIARNKESDTISLDYGDFEVNVKTGLTIDEKSQFIERVFENAYIGHIVPSQLKTDVVFVITFMQFLTDIPIPTLAESTDEIVDNELAYNIMRSLNIIHRACMESRSIETLVDELQQYIKDRIEFQNARLIAYAGVSDANSTAIEAVSSVMYKIDDLLNAAIDLLQKNGNKIAKNLTSKKINKWVEELQTKVVDSLKDEDKNPVVDINSYAAK